MALFQHENNNPSKKNKNKKEKEKSKAKTSGYSGISSHCNSLLLVKGTRVFSNQQRGEEGERGKDSNGPRISNHNNTSSSSMTTTNFNNTIHSNEIGQISPSIPLSSLQLEDLTRLQASITQQEDTIHELEHIEGILNSLLERRVEEGEKKVEKLNELMQRKQVEVEAL